MSYGYMVFSKTSSVLLVKNRMFRFQSLPDCGHYKVYSRLHQGTSGLVDSNGDKNSISNEGSALFSDLYAEVGQFYFMYFLMHHHEGDKDVAKKMHLAIERGKTIQSDFGKGTFVHINLPYLMQKRST